ncbi:hypothetical protein ADK59_34400 [Streptomyces sp. XY332]|nr:hypothetical protein ADK59_34400 [Streptomyces sp. XY332]
MLMGSVVLLALVAWEGAPLPVMTQLLRLVRPERRNTGIPMNCRCRGSGATRRSRMQREKSGLECAPNFWIISPQSVRMTHSPAMRTLPVKQRVCSLRV